MNFFGHACVAVWRSSKPSFVLGSMLPDFASMVGSREPQLTASPASGELREGVQFHHDTDAEFHSTPQFRALMAHAFEDLRRRGLARGPARAVSHIGVEILLDGELAHDPARVDAYRRALLEPTHEQLGPQLAWANVASAARLTRLRAALFEREIGADSRSPEIVAERLARTLKGRARLQLEPQDLPRVRDWAASAQRDIAVATSPLLTELRTRLARRGSLRGRAS